MNIEKVDNDKIKVTVNPKEQKEYGITYETMNYSDANTRRLCERIMSKASREMGFRVGNSRLLVEARQSVNGNVTLYLSRIPSDRKDIECRNFIYKFGTFDDLWDAIEIFRGKEKWIQSSDIIEISPDYYLFFEIVSSEREAERICMNLGEFGEHSEMSLACLKEYGASLTSGTAIHKLLKAEYQE